MMPELGAAPLLEAGAHVEVDLGGTTVNCRFRGLTGGAFHLIAPNGTPRARTAAARNVRLTFYVEDVRWETEAVVRQWIWAHPPVLVVARTGEWRQTCRRRGRREQHEFSARLRTPSGGDFVAKTLDLSGGGASLLVSGRTEIQEGEFARLELSLNDDVWCEDVPVRVVRVRNLLRSGSRSVEIGVRVEEPSVRQAQQWRECLSRLAPRIE